MPMTFTICSLNRFALSCIALLAFTSGCTFPTAPVELTISGKAYFRSAQSTPEVYPAAGTQHTLKTGQSIDLQITLTGVGSFTGTATGALATCPTPGKASPFTTVVSDTLVVTEQGTYSTVLDISAQVADFGNGCITALFNPESLTNAAVKASIAVSTDTCMNYQVNKILLDCETECTGNSQCLSQCPVSRLPGAVHGCSPQALADPLSPKNILARPVLTAAQLALFDTAFLGGTVSQNVSTFDLEFSELEFN